MNLYFIVQLSLELFPNTPIAQQHADNDTIKAKAQELAVNWGIGEYKNWKTWVDLGANALKTITSIIK